jgi:transposase
MQLHTITELLAIPNYHVSHMVVHSDSRLDLLLEPSAFIPAVCSGCGRIHNTPIHSSGMIVVEDLPISGKRVFLHVPKRKSLCIEDDRIRTEELAWLKGRFTKRLAEQVCRLTSITTNQEAGWYLGLDDEVVYRIDRQQLEELARRKLSPVPAPTSMSVDEVAWKKWHHYVTNVVDIDKRKVIWNHDGRGKSVLDSFYEELGAEHCATIEAVASDGARGFLSATKQHAKNGLIVLDHFHVKKYLNDAVDTVRKEELNKARKADNAELVSLLHCNKRFILMQNKPSSRKADLLGTLADLNEPIYKSMLLKDQFLTIYASRDRASARESLHQWIVSAITSGLPAFIELGFKFFRKRHFVLNYFICKITTAISEGINNKIKRLKRMAYGYKDVTYFLLKIHQHCGLLNPRLQLKNE